jgi:hypothetical protein
MKLATGIAVLTVALASAYSAPSVAQEATVHANASQPTARCQGALPVFETMIRKRPLAVQNEGSANTFVTCSFEFDAYNAVNGEALMVDAWFTNNNAEDVTLTCTAVSGWQTGDNEYVQMSTTVVANGAEQGNLFWVGEDFAAGGLETGLVSISCALPAGVGVNDTYVFWATDDAPV